jgi:hypothetical protein
MAAVESRSVAQIADWITADDLHTEYDEITERMTSAPLIHSLHAYATLCAVAMARVKVLETER